MATSLPSLVPVIDFAELSSRCGSPALDIFQPAAWYQSTFNLSSDSRKSLGLGFFHFKTTSRPHVPSGKFSCAASGRRSAPDFFLGKTYS